MSDNIFDIEKLAKKKRDVEVKHKEIDVSKLADYDELPMDDVANIPANTFIYYMNKGGDTHKGFVKMVRQDADGIKLDISSYLGVNSKNWVVRLSKIEKIWKKKDMMPAAAMPTAMQYSAPMHGAAMYGAAPGAAMTPNRDIEDLREEIKAMRETVNTLKGKILQMEDDQKKAAYKLQGLAKKI